MEVILKKKCPNCGKEITSMYQKQLDYNYEAHLISCNNSNQVKKPLDNTK